MVMQRLVAIDSEGCHVGSKKHLQVALYGKVSMLKNTLLRLPRGLGAAHTGRLVDKSYSTVSLVRRI